MKRPQVDAPETHFACSIKFKNSPYCSLIRYKSDSFSAPFQKSVGDMTIILVFATKMSTHASFQKKQCQSFVEGTSMGRKEAVFAVCLSQL